MTEKISELPIKELYKLAINETEELQFINQALITLIHEDKNNIDEKSKEELAHKFIKVAINNKSSLTIDNIYQSYITEYDKKEQILNNVNKTIENFILITYMLIKEDNKYYENNKDDIEENGFFTHMYENEPHISLASKSYLLDKEEQNKFFNKEIKELYAISKIALDEMFLLPIDIKY